MRDAIVGHCDSADNPDVTAVVTNHTDTRNDYLVRLEMADANGQLVEIGSGRTGGLLPGATEELKMKVSGREAFTRCSVAEVLRTPSFG
jgi:hypothetical protein